MKKSGFTLIELLVTLAILAVIILIVVPSIGVLITNSEEQIYNNSVKSLEDAARSYLYEHPNLLPSTIGQKIDVTLDTLITNGYMEAIKDPSAGSLTCDGIVSVILNSDEETIYYPILNCSVYKKNYIDSSIISSISTIYNAGNYITTINLATDHNTYGVNVGTRKIAFYKPNMIDYSTWVLGTTGSQTGFNRNGLATENTIITKANPWGKNDTIWGSEINDITSNDDGGWGTTTFNIDATKKYRFSVWLRRENIGTGSGTSYFGVSGYDASSNHIGVLNLSSTLNTNLYFGSASSATWSRLNNEWLLFITYMQPSTYALTTSDPTTGIYDLNGNKVYSLVDAKWQSTNAKASHRTYLYYSTKVDERQYWYRPRVDLVDGTEPSLATLLAGTENPNLGDYTEKVTTNTFTYTTSTPGVQYFYFNKKDGTVVTIPYEVAEI